jgi:RHS repeat-associated protein
MQIRNILPIVTFILTSFIVASGQQTQYDKGTPPQLAAGVSSAGSYMSTELGTVNLTNGGLNLNIPLGTVGGRGNVAIPLTLNYSSKVWSASTDVDTERESGTEQSVAYADYDNQSSFAGAAAPGWTLRTGMYLSTNFVRIKKILSGPSVGCYTYGLNKLTLNLPDKGEVEFRDDATDGAPLFLNCTTQQTTSRGTRWHATDGSGAIFINDVDNGVGLFPTPNLTGTVIFADGTRFSTTTNGAIVDRNGNQITGTFNGYTDQLGRNISIQYGVADPDNPSVTLAVLITLPGYQGASRYYKIKTGIMNQNYRSDINPTLPVISGDWDPEGWGYNWGTATRLFAKSYGLFAQRIDDREVLTELVLPDGRSLKFRYNEFGEVAEVQLPTGAKIQYDYLYRSALPSGNSPSWETGTNGAGSGIVSDVKFVDRAVTTKRTYPDGVNLEGTFTFGYATQVVNSVTYPATTVSVTSNTSALLTKQRHIFLPAGRYTEAYSSQSTHDGTHYTLWSTGVEWRTESLDAADNVLAATEQDWTQRAPVSWSSYPQEQPAKDNRVNQTRRYLETGMMAKVETSYDQYNNPTEVKEYDYDQTLKRRTVTSYLSTNNGYNYQTDDSIHLLGLPETQTIYDGSGNQVARTVTEYDVYMSDGNHDVLTGYASVSQHDSNYGTAKTTRGNPTRIGVWLNTTGAYIYTYPRYDILGNVVSAKDALGNVSTISFADDFGNGSNPGTPTQNPSTPTYALPTLITSPPPVPGAPVHTARSQYDYSTGLLTGFRDRNNVVTQTFYSDPFNRPTQVKSALGISGIESRTLMYYAPASTPFGITLTNNDVLTAKDQTVNTDSELRSWTVTDGFGRTKESWQRDPQGDVKVVTTYDALSRARQVSNPFRPSLSETAVYTETTYDLLGRITAVTTPDGAVVNSAFSANTATVTDQAGKKRKSVTDALGRLKEVYEDPTGLNYLTSYQYDTVDNLTTVTQGTQTRTFTYNSLKQLLTATNPESGTISYQYDQAGNLLVKTDARGVSSHFAYDAFNRPTRRWYNGSSSTSATTHNSPALPGSIGTSNEATFFYDVQSLPTGAPGFSRGAANGRMVAVTYGTNSSTGDYSGYDSAGRNVLKIQQTGSINYLMSTTLNLSGAPTAMVYPSGHTVTIGYDVAGRTSSVVGNLGDGTSQNYATDFSYSALGGLTKEKFGTTSSVYHKLHYNVRGQLYDVRASNVNDDSSGELGALVNYYSSNGVYGGSGADNNGNVVKSQTIINSFSMEDRYSYDALNRLASVNEYQNGTTNTGLQQYDYDRWGNRTINPATWGTGINNKGFTVDTSNNRLNVPSGQSGVMSYDAAGNLTDDTYTGAGNRTYDAENKITSAWGGNNQAQLYGYDANGQRIKRTVNGVETWQVYGFGGELLAEYPVNGVAASPQKEYGYRNGQLLVTAEPSSAQQGTQNVSWTNAVGVSVSGNNLTKNAPDNWANSGAASSQAIVSGDGYIELTATETNTFRMIGLSHGDANQDYTDIDFAAYLATTNLCIYEAGVSRGCVSTYTTGDTIRVAVESGVVKYKKNGAVVYTSTVAPTYPLLVDTALWNNGSTLNNVVISGLLSGGVPQNTQNVNWTGGVGVSVVGNSITKTTTDNWANSGAVSSQSITSGDGYVEVTASETNTFRMIGLSHGDSNQDYTDIDFAAYLASTNLCIYEAGVSRGCVSTYTTGDTIRVAVESGVVKYKKNGVVVYTSTVSPSYPLLVDTALWNNGSTLNNVVISGNLSGGSGSGTNVHWLVTDHLGTPRMIIDQTGSLANIKRHDYLPFGEELFAPAGGRNSTQGYSGGDNIRQQFTSKERDTETGLDYFLARYHSSIQGRFTSPDEFAGGPTELFIAVTPHNPTFYADLAEPQSLNKYQYCLGNPLRYVDFDGHQTATADDILNAYSGGTVRIVQGTIVHTAITFGQDGWLRRGYRSAAAALPSGPLRTEQRVALQQETRQKMTALGRQVSKLAAENRKDQLALKTAAQLEESAGRTSPEQGRSGIRTSSPSLSRRGTWHLSL